MPDALFEQLLRFQQLASEMDWRTVASGALATVIGSWMLGIPRYMSRLLRGNQGRGSGTPGSWRDDPVTRKQVRRLVKLGVPRHVAERMTKGEASDQIVELQTLRD